MPAKNSSLVTLTNWLSNMPSADLQLLFRFKKSGRVSENDDISNLVGALGEEHVRDCIEKYCSQTGANIKLDPIKPSQKSGFKFSYIKGNVVITINDDVTYCEYDQVALVSGLPVIFEVKVGKYGQLGSSKTNTKEVEFEETSPVYITERGTISNLPGKGRRQYIPPDAVKPKVTRQSFVSPSKPGSLGVAHAMTQRRIAYLARPVQEYFGRREFGYVLVASPEHINPNKEEQRVFKQNGGILVPFFATRKEFSAMVEQWRGTYKI